MGQMNWFQARKIARTQPLINGSDTSLFPDFNVDIAATQAINSFSNETKYTKRVDAVTLAPGTSTLPAMPAGFTSGRLLKAYMTSANVQSWAGGWGSWISYTSPGGPFWDPVGGGWGMNAELEVVDIGRYYNALRAWPVVQQPGWITFNTQNTGFIYPQTPSSYQATANMSGTYPTMDLATVTINNPGTNIYSAPTTMVSDGFGGTANIAFTLSAGVITAITPSGSNGQFKQAPNVSGAPLLTANPMVQYTLAIEWWEPMTAFQPGTQGAWSSSNAYYVNDVVSVSTELWQCNTPQAVGGASPSAPNWTDLGAGTITAPTAITAPATLPDDVLQEILSIGTPCYLQFNNPAFLAQARADFADLKARYSRMASHGVKGFSRIPARPVTYGGGNGNTGGW